MERNMNQGSVGDNSGFLHIKELKEKVRSLVSEVDLNQKNAKFKHEKNFDSDTSDSRFSDENDDEFLDCSEMEFRSETNWLSEQNASDNESVKDICSHVYVDLDVDRPEVTSLFRELESSAHSESNILTSQRPSIDSRTFTRPKKCLTRPPLTSVLNSEDGRPKLQRRLTTTISPSPNLVSKLEELSKNNNRPVSGNYDDVKWEEGSQEGLAETRQPPLRPKRQSLPASLFDRLQELKKANSSFKIPNVVDPEPPNGRIHEERTNHLLEDAKKVTAALDVNLKNPHSSRLSEIFRNTQDYYSDDNESFISLDEVSGFCDRLTLSTDQSTYSSIVREMEENEICLFHRPLKSGKIKESRITFGGVEIPGGNSSRNLIMDEEDTDLNRTYHIDEEELSNKPTFDANINLSKENHRNASKNPPLVDVIIKNLSPNNNVKRSSNSEENATNNNNNNNNININNRTLVRHSGSNLINYTYQKLNNTLDQNELNALHGEKYSTKVFDSSFGKTEPELTKSSARKANGKRDQSDQSEDDCMSTTSDHSYRSVDSNSEPKTMDDIRTVTIKKTKKLSSTPITNQMGKFNFGVISPIKMEMGDGESRAYSNPSSRGQSPRRGLVPTQQEGVQKHRMSSLKQPLKVPQRELKLKPALIRPSQNFKRPLSYTRTSSEPSVPQKVEQAFQPVASVPALRPLGPAAVPSLTNVKPSTRASGIPRPPTRLKQPQIRYSGNLDDSVRG